MATPMNLIIPTVSATPGPQYAAQINTALSTVEQHNHSPGKGNPILVAGLAFDNDFVFNVSGLSKSVLALFSAGFAAQPAPLSGGLTTHRLYDVLGDLWWNNAGGQTVQITSGNGLNVSAFGGILGLAGSLGRAIYTSGAGNFTWWQQLDSNGTILGSLVAGSLVLNNTDGTNYGWRLRSDPAQSANYTLTLPIAPPTGAGSFPVLMSNAGGLSTLQNAGGFGWRFVIDPTQAVSYALTLPVAPPSATLPVQMSSSGALSPIANATGKGWTFAVQAGQGANKTLTLPTGYPGSLAALTMDNAGTLTTTPMANAADTALAGTIGGTVPLAELPVVTTGPVAAKVVETNGSGVVDPSLLPGTAPAAVGGGAGGWTTAGVTNWKDVSGIVHIKGVVSKGAGAAAGQEICTLGPGFRPGFTCDFPVMVKSTNAPIYQVGLAEITSGGSVTIAYVDGSPLTGTTTIDLTSVSFLAEN